ncbi:hypothetical protein ABK040_001630 [Willaertia magna]
MSQLPVFVFSYEINKEEHDSTKDLLQNYFKKEIHELIIEERKDNNYFDVRFSINNNNSKHHFFTLEFQTYKLLQKNKTSIKISVLNVKDQQLILKIEKNKYGCNEMSYLLLGRYKPFKLKSLFIHKLSNNFGNNFTKIYKNIFKNFTNFTQISLNAVLTPEISYGLMLCDLKKYQYEHTYGEVKRPVSLFYYDTVGHWCALRRDHLNYYATHVTTGFIYRDKEIKIDNSTLVFDWLVELSDGTKYVFGKMSGGNGVFPLKNIVYWSQLCTIDKFRTCVEF